MVACVVKWCGFALGGFVLVADALRSAAVSSSRSRFGCLFVPAHDGSSNRQAPRIKLNQDSSRCAVVHTHEAIDRLGVNFASSRERQRRSLSPG